MKKELLLIVLFIYSCSSSVQKEYSGYLYEGEFPLKKVKVIERNTKNFTFTNEKGFFKLKRSNLNTVNDLIIENLGHKDTLNLLRGSGAGSKMKYVFLNGTSSDTINIQNERLFNKQSSGY